MSTKSHWENIYTTKTPNDVSWTEAKPSVSLDLIEQCGASQDASIIDIGGGDSLLIDHLLKLGYTNVSVLDISAAAIKRAKARLGNEADRVTWIVSDITEFEPKQIYDVCQDRAVSHFLTEVSDIDNYKKLVTSYAKNITLGTFSTNGPVKCSGLEITQYDEQKIRETFCPPFNLIECFNKDHITPFNTVQNFTFSRLII